MSEQKEIVSMELKNKEVQEVTEVQEKVEGNNSFFEDFSAAIEQINPQLGGFEELGVLLALPDEEFDVISKFFLDELEKSVKNPNDQMILVQSLNAVGAKLEDVKEEFAKIVELIDNEEMAATIPQNKRDFLKRMIAITFNAISEAEGIAKKVIQVPIELCREDAKIPTYAHVGDAAVDVYATEDYEIMPGETKIIPTGIKIALPKGYAIMVQPRSGMSAKTKLRIANTPGCVDSNYRGEIGVIAENIDQRVKDVTVEYDENGKMNITSVLFGAPIHIEKGERIAQLRLVEVPLMSFFQVEKVEADTDRGEGAYGSSGK